RNHVRKRRLAQTWRSVQQDMIQRLAPLPGGGDRNVQVLADAILPDVFVKHARAKASFVLRVFVGARGSDDAWVRRHFASSLRACFSVRSNPASRPAVFKAASTARSASGR